MTTLSHAPLTPWKGARLPGMAPLDYADWLQRDEAFAPQMAYRDRLIAEHPDIVITGEGSESAGALLDFVLETLSAHDPGYELSPNEALRPDGARIRLDRGRPLATLGRLAQEDFLLLEKPAGADEHILTGGVLCFPSRWSLAEKTGRPLTAIHDYVPAYDSALAPRVQRLFTALRPEAPMQRANWLVHATGELHQPGGHDKSARPLSAGGGLWLRVERQCILKLAKIPACVFTVKTLITPAEKLTAEQGESLAAALEGQSDAVKAYHGGAAFAAEAARKLRMLAGSQKAEA